jgi:hypothetical protein
MKIVLSNKVETIYPRIVILDIQGLQLPENVRQDRESIRISHVRSFRKESKKF